ncbi:hypothetical protein [Veillonella sp.]|uniref:hypothetical protein n=1 Tax=Veillonella sp. TaxID=1926307 RepID=UPI0025DF325F|nr:hypothetical protein [Veillonella sp.]
MKMTNALKRSLMAAGLLAVVVTPLLNDTAKAADNTKPNENANINAKYNANYNSGNDKKNLEWQAKVIEQLLRGNLDSINEQLNERLQQQNDKADKKQQSRVQKQEANGKLPMTLTSRANLPASYDKQYIQNNFTDVSKYVLDTGFVNSDFRLYVQPIRVNKDVLELVSYGFLTDNTPDMFARYMAYDLKTDTIYYSKYRLNYDANTLKTTEVETFDAVETESLPAVHDEMVELAKQVGY